MLELGDGSLNMFVRCQSRDEVNQISPRPPTTQLSLDSIHGRFLLQPIRDSQLFSNGGNHSQSQRASTVGVGWI